MACTDLQVEILKHNPTVPVSTAAALERVNQWSARLQRELSERRPEEKAHWYLMHELIKRGEAP